MDTVSKLWRSTVGKKAVMAVTGVILSLFVVGHLLGNLLVFAGPAAIDEYGAALHRRPLLLWLFRAGLLLAAGLHAVAAAQLSLLARRARPQQYARQKLLAATFSARAMRVGGVFLLGFVVFHLLHLTLGVVHPAFHSGAVYHNVVSGLRAPGVAAIYLLAMVALGLHLDHGLWSFRRSLGLRRLDDSTLKRPLGRALALFFWFGFSLIPAAVLLGILR